MSEQTTTTSQTPDIEKIDIISLLRDFMHSLKRTWWIIVVLAALGAGAFYFRSTISYTPSYTATATVSVQAISSGTSYDNASATAEQLGKVFPYILTSGVLEDIVAEDMGLDSVPGHISVTNIDGTNLLTIKVTSNDGQTAYDVLQSFIKCYPEVAQYVVGQTELTVIDDRGVPKNNGSAIVMRGSILRGGAVGALIGILIVVVYTVTLRTIRSSSDLKKAINAPYLGTLPIYHKKLRKRKNHNGINILDDDAQLDYVESIRVVRTRLQRRLEAKKLKTIMVTSSIPGEGKSTVAGNLAIALAKQGKRVVLVDCDLRNPSLQEVFNMEGEFPGLASVLRDKVKLRDALYHFEEPGMDLYCLFGAPKGTQRVEILGRKAMGQLIQALEGFADVVILDTPPSAMLVDTSILVRYVKSVVYVVMNDYARRQYILKGVRELSELGVKIEGVVLNGSKDSSYSHSKK